MSTFLLFALLCGAMVGLVIATIVLLILQIRNATQVNKLTFPAYEYVVKQAEHKANEIIATAQKEARSLIAEAEKTGQKTIAEYTTSATQAHETYVHTIEKFTQDLSAHLSEASKSSAAKLESITTAVAASMHQQEASVRTEFETALRSLGDMGGKLELQTAKALADMENRIAAVSQAFTEKLTHEDEAYEQFIDEHLEKAVAAAEAEIAEYKKARLALMDAHIEKLVEDIATRVLHKELTLHDHAELARQALQEAKEHNLL